MAEVSRVQVNWTGWAGAPGYTNLYFQGNLIGTPNLQLAIDNVGAWLEGCLGSAGSYIPGGVQVAVNGEVWVFDETTGLLTDIGHGTPPEPMKGVGSASFASPAGACITWRTSTIVNGRLLRGRSFLVPLANTAMSPSGDLAAGFVNGALVASQTLILGPPNLVVWHRPVSKTGGLSGAVSAVNLTDQAAVLRSRR